MLRNKAMMAGAGLVFTGILSAAAHGQINLTFGTAATQDFNSIGSGSSATLPNGYTANTVNSARTTSGYAGSSSTNGSTIINEGSTTNTSDRAIGFVLGGNDKSGNLFGTYKTLQAANTLQISFNAEKYTLGTESTQVQLMYSTNSTSWTSAGSTFLKTFAADGSTGLGGPTKPLASQTASGAFVLPTPLAANSMFYLAWQVSTASGNPGSGAQQIAVDDISITATPEPTTALLFGGAASAALIGRRRRADGEPMSLLSRWTSAALSV